MPVLPDHEPDTLVEQWPDQFPAVGAAEPVEALRGLLQKVIAQSNHLHHPRYMGHQVTAPLPQAALSELAGTLLNNVMAVYEMGPAATAMERSLLRWMGGQLGFDPARCDGVLTSGGSLGNLTALLAARQDRSGWDAWTEGQAAGPPLAILAGRSAHYSMQRAVQIMGWGREGLLSVPVDERFRLRPEALPEALTAAQARGRRVIAVAASACSTATGSFDPLEPIGEFCRRHALWLHVDAAHGAPACLSTRYRHLLAGIDQADSVVWDAHKMLLMPGILTAVIFRQGSPSYHTFQQQASYLFAPPGPDEQWYNVSMRTVECTKRMMSLHLYAALTVQGTQMFADYVTAAFDLGRRFGELLSQEPDFELPVPPDCNIVCFRYRPAQGPLAAAELDALQAEIRQRLLAAGDFYLVQTQLPAGLHLRVTLINPFTSEADLLALLAAVRAAGREVLKSFAL
jgi:L-2,4-diaminobutyrate decarboxylase